MFQALLDKLVQFCLHIFTLTKTDGWIYPTLKECDLTKKIFIWGDSSFKDTVDTRKLIDENNVATLFLERKDPKSDYDHVPLDPNILPDTPEQKHLLYCLGSSNQTTCGNVNQMVLATFGMLNKVEPELTKKNFHIWIVANPAAYQPTRKFADLAGYQYDKNESVMHAHIDQLKRSINVFDWYGAIVTNTGENYQTIQFSKRGYYDFQKLILYRVMQTMTDIPILRTEIYQNTPMPFVKKCFIKLSPKIILTKLKKIDTISPLLDTNFKNFYDIMSQQSLPYANVQASEGSIAATIDAKTFPKKEFEKVIIQWNHKELNTKVSVKVLNARRYHGDLAELKKQLTSLDCRHIIKIIDIATDKDNFNIFYAVTEHWSNETLFQQICIGRPKKDLFIKWIRNVAEGLIYLHEKNILHCNIKPGNIILDEYHNAKIIDIDNIEWAESSDACMLPSNVQYTDRYAAPEILQHELCDTRVDVWSYSIVVLELIVQILTVNFCQDLRESRHKSLDEVLETIPQSLQKLIREGLKKERIERIFMKNMVPLLDEVEIELQNMKEETWQECAREDFVLKYNQTLLLPLNHTVQWLVRNDRDQTDVLDPETKLLTKKLEKASILDERKFISEKFKLTLETRNKKINADMENKLKNPAKGSLEELESERARLLVDNENLFKDLISRLPDISELESESDNNAASISFNVFGKAYSFIQSLF